MPTSTETCALGGFRVENVFCSPSRCVQIVLKCPHDFSTTSGFTALLSEFELVRPRSSLSRTSGPLECGQDQNSEKNLGQNFLLGRLNLDFWAHSHGVVNRFSLIVSVIMCGFPNIVRYTLPTRRSSLVKNWIHWTIWNKHSFTITQVVSLRCNSFVCRLEKKSKCVLPNPH